MRVRRTVMATNGERECLGDLPDSDGKMITCHNFQKHDQLKQGRVLKCNCCGNEECIECGVRKHTGETCEQFQARMQREHGAEESQTAAALSEGWQIARNGVKKPVLRRPCPFCGALIERKNACEKMYCCAMYFDKASGGWKKCGMEFCMNCGAKFYGKGSVRAMGNAAHATGCKWVAGHEGEDRRFARNGKWSKKGLAGDGGLKVEDNGVPKCLEVGKTSART